LVDEKQGEEKMTIIDVILGTILAYASILILVYVVPTVLCSPLILYTELKKYFKEKQKNSKKRV
jgi:hypothetical protein